MMPMCQIKNCENNGLVMFGGKVICGECYMKIYNKQMQEQKRLMEEIENDN